MKRLSQWMLPGLLAFSLGANLWLAHRLRLTEETVLRAGRLSPGEIVPAIGAKLDSGRPVRLDWAAQTATLIYYFDPGCGWCSRNEAAFGALVDQIGAGVKVYSYTSELRGLAEFRQQTHHVGLVITDDREDLRRILGLHGTPQTLVIDAAGRVLRNWAGAYTGPVRTEIQEYFHVHLPELPDRPNA